MKTNPLYNYLVKNIQLARTKWMQKENLCLYPLAFQGNLGYVESESNLDVIEHHISVYPEMAVNLGFSSLYHYTATLSNHTKLRIYFDTNDQPFQVTLTTPSNPTLFLTDLLKEENSQISDFCFLVESQVQEIIQPLRAEQDISIDKLKTTYISQLTEITNSLFEQEQTMVSIEPFIQATIKLGQELLTICYKKKFFKATLRFLNKSLTCLEECPETSLEQQAMPTASEIVIPDSETSSSMLFDSVHGHPTQAKSPNKNIMQQTFQERIEQFESARLSYLSKLDDFESEQDLSSKLILFSKFAEYDLPELNGQYLCLDELLENLSKKQQFKYEQASLEIALLTQNNEKKGVDLLFKCLEQEEKHLLKSHENTFKCFIMMLSREQIKQIVLKQNLSALQFLLKNSEFNLNHYVIQMGPDQLLSPLCVAFEFKNLDMFKMFLKNKASCLALYKDLPLAHTLLELDSKDSFQQAFFEYSLDIRGKNKINLYKTLASSILTKWKDKTLDSTLKSHLKNTYRKYIETSKGLESSTVSKSTVAVSNFFDSSAIPVIGRLTWEEKEPLRELQRKLNELTEFTSKHKRNVFRQLIDHHKQISQGILSAGCEDSIKSINKNEILLKAKKETECCTKVLRMLQLSSKKPLTQNEIKELKDINLFFSSGENPKHQLEEHIGKKLDEIKTVAKQYKKLLLLNGRPLKPQVMLLISELSHPKLWLKRDLSCLDNMFQLFNELFQNEIELRVSFFCKRFYNRLPFCFDHFLKNMFFQCQDMPKDKTLTDPYGPGSIMSFH